VKINRQPVIARLPSITNRRQFKVWLILQLGELGADLPTDPSYKELQDALVCVFARLLIREG
jgi:hypothetical protein